MVFALFAATTWFRRKGAMQLDGIVAVPGLVELDSGVALNRRPPAA
ncbi:hypothetical protein P3102_10985 [Amycolatopsis sp. QT-25]|nr:hypothetical protein [Amycolatopsis sp. QT-25]WET81686.1 hypothetical protein P3102_10985 [Amycolatopsis sp. QT-25]